MFHKSTALFIVIMKHCSVIHCDVLKLPLHFWWKICFSYRGWPSCLSMISLLLCMEGSEFNQCDCWYDPDWSKLVKVFFSLVIVSWQLKCFFVHCSCFWMTMLIIVYLFNEPRCLLYRTGQMMPETHNLDHQAVLIISCAFLPGMSLCSLMIALSVSWGCCLFSCRSTAGRLQWHKNCLLVNFKYECYCVRKKVALKVTDWLFWSVLCIIVVDACSQPIPFLPLHGAWYVGSYFETSAEERIISRLIDNNNLISMLLAAQHTMSSTLRCLTISCPGWDTVVQVAFT